MAMAVTARSRILVPLILLSFALSLAIATSGLFKGFELKAYDLLSRTCNPPKAPESLVIVKVDQASLDSLNSEGITWPWPRQVYAALIEHLSEAEAVFLDVLFLEPSSYGHHDDLMLAEAIRNSSRVYLPMVLTNRREGLNDRDKEFLQRNAVGQVVQAGPAYRSAILPLDILTSAITGVGNVTIRPDEDGVYRAAPLFFRADRYTVGHFVLPYLLQKGIVTVRQGEPFIGDAKIPLSGGRLLMRYPASDEPFTSLSAADILKAHADTAASRQPSIGKEYFRGRYVFIGLTAAGLFDLKPTAVSPVSTGVEIHAATFENILYGNFIRPLGLWCAVAFMLLICACVTYFVLKHHSLVAHSIALLAASAVVVFVPAAAFTSGFYLLTVPPALSLVLSFGMASTYSYATEAKERRFIRRVFSQYMDERIVRHVLRHPEIIKPGGQKRFVTVFFVDIAGFTSMAERLAPEDTVSVLHAVLDGFTEVIIAEGGVIDKYIGDSIMAFWGAPLSTDRDETSACAAALRCISTLDEINERFSSEGLPSISVRIGIHSGNVIVGNLGSDRLFDYTVVGDPVNVASRLESANKLLHTKIIVSEETLGRTGDRFLARELGMIEVKGKTIPLRIFEILGTAEGSTEALQYAAHTFNSAIALFQEGKLPDSLSLFEEVLRRHPDDGPSAFYAARCKELIGQPALTEDWKILKMMTK
jgi:adenylate cyclase